MNLDKKQMDLIDFNYVSATGLLTANTVIGEFLDSFKMSIFNSGVPNRLLNIVFIKEGTSKPEKLLNRGEEFFNTRNLPFRVSFRHGLEKGFLPLLKDKGYTENKPETVMSLMNLPDINPVRNDLQIKKVIGPDELGHFQKIVEKSYSLPEGSGPYAITDRLLGMPDVTLFVGYVDNQPACTSMLVKTGCVAGIYWVGTLDEFRNRGFGYSITMESIVAGKMSGCDFACLQASAMGKPVYEKIGFENPYNYINFSSP